VEISSEQLAAERRQLRQSLDRLMARMESIEKAVETANKLAHATTPPSEKMAGDSAVKNLTVRLDSLEENGATMKTLLNRMDRMEESAAEHTEAEAKTSNPDDNAAPHDAAALVLAVENLSQALATNDPFEAALEALKALAGDNPNINAAVVLLAKYATSGLSTLPDLKQRFADIAGKIVHASRITEKTGWLDRVSNRLSSLATWRRIDGKGSDTPIDDMVAAAESQLKAGDLKAAVTAVGGLSVNAKAAAVANPWLVAAKARLAADRAVASLHIHAITQLTPIKPVKG
jgi:uroporphyrinogen-III synthase